MKNPRQAFYVFLGLVGVGVVGGIAVFYLFDSQLASLNQEIGELKAEQEVVEQQIAIYETAERQVSELSFVKDLANDVLPASKEQANVVAELKRFINQSGLQFDSLTFSGSDPGTGGLDISQTQAQSGLVGVRVLPVTVVIQAGATYGELITLLETIENNRRKMQVTEISLTPEADTNTFSSTTLQVDVYLRTDAPAQPATEDSQTETGNE